MRYLDSGFWILSHKVLLNDPPNSLRHCKLKRILASEHFTMLSYLSLSVYQVYFKFLLHEEKMVELNTEEHKKSGEAENSFLGLMYGQYMLPGGIADV